MGEDLVSLVSFDDPFGHAENIGTAISQALRDAGVGPTDITAVAIGRGPAPYTGLRVGMAAGLAFARGRDLPIYGVVALDAVAHSMQVHKLLLYADAKRKELFVAGYQAGVRVFGPQVMLPDELAKFQDFEQHQASCDAGMIGRFAQDAIQKGIDLSDISALYLRSPDVSPSGGKRVTG